MQHYTRADSAASPKVGYWHLWTDAQGESHQARCELERFELGNVGAGASAPQWDDKELSGDARVVFTALPAGWVADWQENLAPQWIVPLSGRWFVEAMDGTRVDFGPGELSLGEDQNCALDASGRRGHRSGTVGDEPVVLLCIRLHRPPKSAPATSTSTEAGLTS